MATLGMMYHVRGVWFGVRWGGCDLKSGGSTPPRGVLYNIHDTKMSSDHDETIPSIAAVSASSMLAVQQQKRLRRQFVDVFYQTICMPRCHWDKNYTWQKELRGHWSNNLEQSSGRSATPLVVTAVIWTKTETVFVWAMSAPEEFCLSRAIQMFALLLLLLLLLFWWAACTKRCICCNAHISTVTVSLDVNYTPPRRPDLQSRIIRGTYTLCARRNNGIRLISG